MAFLKLIRWKNIVVIALTQYLIRYSLIYPILKVGGFELQLSNLYFGFIVIATCLIAAAGNIINDYFDIRIDSINKPNENIIGTKIKRQHAIALHLAFNFIAFALAFFVSYKTGNYKFTLVYIVAAGALWYYSTNFKMQFLIGNIVVATLIAMVPIIVGMHELPLLNATYAEILKQYNTNFNYIGYFILGFSTFAFLSGLQREIIKDCEDMEGDREYGSNSVPLVLGLKKTNYIILAIGLIIITALGYLQIKQITAKDYLSFCYFLIAVQIPMLYLMFKTFKAKEKRDYTFLSKLSKLIMVLGTLYSLAIYYSLLIAK